MTSIQEKEKNTFKALKDNFNWTNPMEAPRLKKVIISVGTGSLKDKAKVELIQDRLAKITGQKAAPTKAKKSIASFKVREGDTVGYVVTLRGQRMYDFLERFLRISLPRTKDFRGIPKVSVDDMGNYSMGITEHTIFPETSNEEIRDVFGFGLNVVTSAHSKKEASAFLEHLGFPFRKEEKAKA